MFGVYPLSFFMFTPQKGSSLNWGYTYDFSSSYSIYTQSVQIFWTIDSRNYLENGFSEGDSVYVVAYPAAYGSGFWSNTLVELLFTSLGVPSQVIGYALE